MYVIVRSWLKNTLNLPFLMEFLGFKEFQGRSRSGPRFFLCVTLFFQGDSRAFQGYSRTVQGISGTYQGKGLQEHLRDFPGDFKSVLGVVMCYRRIPVSFKNVPRLFQSVSGGLGVFQGFSKGLQGCSQQLQGHSRGTLGVPGGLRGFQGVSTGFRGVPENYWGFRRIRWFQGVLEISRAVQGVFQGVYLNPFSNPFISKGIHVVSGSFKGVSLSSRRFQAPYRSILGVTRGIRSVTCAFSGF